MLIESKRQAVLTRDNHRCRACGFSDDLTMEIDHVKPRSLGGSDDLDNLQALCSFCNNTKGNTEIDSLAIQAPCQGFGDQTEVTLNRLAFRQFVADARNQAFHSLLNQARAWKNAGARTLTIRKRLNKLTTNGHVDEIIRTM